VLVSRGAKHARALYHVQAKSDCQVESRRSASALLAVADLEDACKHIDDLSRICLRLTMPMSIRFADMRGVVARIELLFSQGC
jgi:hypothetical protein